MKKMKKTVMDWLLAVVVGSGVCLGFAGCSDDEGKDGGAEGVGGGTVMNTTVSDDEMVLAGLLSSWTDFDQDRDLKGGIIGGTFDPTEGEVTDSAQPFVRTVNVGTMEGADRYASGVLDVIGCPAVNPDGFSWQNAAIGSVTYKHVAQGNVLAVIDVAVKQLPKLTRIRLTAESELNDGETAYYRKGDIVRNVSDGKLYICVSEHQAGQKSVWISFDSNAAQRRSQGTNTAYWINTGYDFYYSKQQATYGSMTTWLTNWILNDAGYEEVKARLTGAGITSATEVNEIVPGTQWQRERLIRGLTLTEESAIFEAWQRMASDRDSRITVYDYDVTEEKRNSWQIRTYKPTGLLLTNMMRWTMSSFDYWVPYVTLVSERDFARFKAAADALPSQTTLSAQHFAWQELLDEAFFMHTETMSPSLTDRYHICAAALHWTHDSFRLTENSAMTYYGLLDFTKENEGLESDDWIRTNITSHEITYKDKGRNSKFESIYVGSER